MKAYIASLTVFMVLVVPFVATASPVLRSGENVSIDAGQMVEGDFYAAGGIVTVSGSILGDLLTAGGSVTINAPIGADATIAGGTVQLHAPVSDDVRIAGGEVTLASEVSGDVVIFGGAVRILSTAHIQGDLIFFGGDLIVEGPIEGSVLGFAESMRFDSFVGGDLSLTATDGVTVGDKAEIQGDLTYRSRNDIVRAANAVVVGEVIAEDFPSKDGSAEPFVISLLMVLFAALVALLVFRKHLTKVVMTVGDSYGKQGLIGLGTLVLTPLVTFILLASVIGMYVGFFLLAAYIGLLIVASVLSGIVFGSHLMKLRTKQLTVSITTVIVGVVGLALVALIPVIGPLVGFVIMLVVLGNLVTRMYREVMSR